MTEGKNVGPVVEEVENDVVAAATIVDAGPNDCCSTLEGRASSDKAGGGAMLGAGHKAAPGLVKSEDI